ncbi:MAG: hypothetical protein ABJP45_11705 [Cyclobacteriaceae bacterium]
MKKINITFLITILLLSVTATESHGQLFPTKLKITVIDGLGNFVEDAVVTIYRTKEDYQASENLVFTGMTDEKGRIKFKDAKPLTYFIDARKDEMNNDGEGVKTGPLKTGRVTRVNTIIE